MKINVSTCPPEWYQQPLFSGSGSWTKNSHFSDDFHEFYIIMLENFLLLWNHISRFLKNNTSKHFIFPGLLRTIHLNISVVYSSIGNEVKFQELDMSILRGNIQCVTFMTYLKKNLCSKFSNIRTWKKILTNWLDHAWYMPVMCPGGGASRPPEKFSWGNFADKW